MRGVLITSILLVSILMLSAQPKASKGLINLDSVDFTSDKVLLSGEWEFYPEKLLTLKDLQTVAHPDAYIHAPRMWCYKHEKDSIIYPGRYHGTYRLRVIGLPKGEIIGFYIHKIFSSSKVFIDGKELLEHGKVGTNKETSSGNFTPEVVPFLVKNDTTDIIVQVSSYLHNEGGMFESIELGNFRKQQSEMYYHIIFDMLLFGSILIMALYHLVLYVMRRKSISALYFAIFSGFVALRTLLTGSESLNFVFPDFPWLLSQRLEYITFFAGAGSFVIFVRSLYSEIPKLFVKIFVGVSVAFTLALVAPIEYHAILTTPFQIIVMVVFGFLLFGLIKAVVRKQPHSLLLLIMIFFFFGTVVNDILLINGTIHSIEVAPLGLFAFIFAQSFILAKRFNTAFIDNEKLTETLDYQNKNLEKIVVERTAEIAEQKEELIAQSVLLQGTNTILEKLSIVADKTDNAVVIADKNGEIEWFNDGFVRLYGYTYEEFLSNFGSNLNNISSNQDLDKLLLQVKKDKHSIQYESGITSKSGKKIWVQTTLTPVLNDSNDIVKLVAIDSDVSPLKQAQAEILLRNEEIMTQKEALQQKTEEILAQRDELELINKRLDIQNENIKAGIRYALNIQMAILPKVSTIKELFPETFVMYRPKDIVSGDFYWFANANVGNTHFLAVVDCTGHGVPGAFMSMIGVRLLSSIVNERNITDPAQILEAMDTSVIQALKQKSSDYNDGMDICLIKYEKKSDTSCSVIFSGAKSPLYIVKSGSEKLQRIGGTRRSIGGTNIRTDKQAFENHEFILSKGDNLYLTSDGIIDQNNMDRTRFGSARFEQLLVSVAKYQATEQQDIIKDIFDRWRGREEQRDDVTLIGVKL